MPLNPDDIKQIKQHAQDIFDDSLHQSQFEVGPVPVHAHTGVDSLQVNAADLIGKKHPRVITVVQSATPEIDTDVTDVAYITGLAQNITSFTTNLTGGAFPYDSLIISITDNGSARTLSWGSKFENSTLTLPTTTVASQQLLVGFFWNPASSKWRLAAIA